MGKKEQKRPLPPEALLQSTTCLWQEKTEKHTVRLLLYNEYMNNLQSFK
jgi:hypothetical protein